MPLYLHVQANRLCWMEFFTTCGGILMRNTDWFTAAGVGPLVIKRNGTRTPFDPNRICAAITRAGRAAGEFDASVAGRITEVVLNKLQPLVIDRDPTIELIQDHVELTLMDEGFYLATASWYAGDIGITRKWRLDIKPNPIQMGEQICKVVWIQSRRVQSDIESQCFYLLNCQ